MKFARFFTLALFVATTFTFTSCNSDDDDENCLGTLQGRWKVDGVEETAYVGLLSRSVDLMSMTFSVCPYAGNTRTLTLTILDYPPLVGTQEIREGQNSSSINGKCYYTSDENGVFFTDSVQTGTFTITSVDPVARTLSATFQLTARSSANASQTITITEGELYNLQYPN